MSYEEDRARLQQEISDAKKKIFVDQLKSLGNITAGTAIGGALGFDIPHVIATKTKFGERMARTSPEFRLALLGPAAIGAGLGAAALSEIRRVKTKADRSKNFKRLEELQAQMRQLRDPDKQEI